MLFKKKSQVRTRIAPSPTGPLHIGTARTALFNYLFAKKHAGTFVLRIEDTDLERSDPKCEKDIFEGLSWLDIEADESPKKGGHYGPYRQSERITSYKKYLEKLLAEGHAFFCFHSEKELEKEKELFMKEKKPPIHWCEFKDALEKEIEKLRKERPSRIIRFRTPKERKIEFDDMIRGRVSFASDFLGDFSIAKDIGVPLYNFAVVTDDFDMQISHVIRGEDHLSNTPKQILIQEALGFPRPAYAHLPLILGPDRSKLSKRHGATSIGEYREEGYLPEALFNFMALLGWNPGDNREIFSKEELIQEFSLEKVQKSGAIFDIAKLEWMNGEYIRKKPIDELVQLCLPYLEKAGLLKNQESRIKQEYLEKITALEQPRLKKLSEIGERVDYFFRAPEYDKELLRWKGMDDKEILGALERAGKVISNLPPPISKEEAEEAFLKEIGDGDKGRILWPLRAALTGKKASPGPFEIMEILGAEESLRKVEGAKQKFMSET